MAKRDNPFGELQIYVRDLSARQPIPAHVLKELGLAEAGILERPAPSGLRANRILQWRDPDAGTQQRSLGSVPMANVHTELTNPGKPNAKPAKVLRREGLRAGAQLQRRGRRRNV